MVLRRFADGETCFPDWRPTDRLYKAQSCPRELWRRFSDAEFGFHDYQFSDSPMHDLVPCCWTRDLTLRFPSVSYVHFLVSCDKKIWWTDDGNFRVIHCVKKPVKLKENKEHKTVKRTTTASLKRKTPKVFTQRTGLISYFNNTVFMSTCVPPRVQYKLPCSTGWGTFAAHSAQRPPAVKTTDSSILKNRNQRRRQTQFN